MNLSNRSVSKLFVVDRNTWYHNGLQTNGHWQKKMAIKNAMEYLMYINDCNQALRIDLNFGII